MLNIGTYLRGIVNYNINLKKKKNQLERKTVKEVWLSQINWKKFFSSPLVRGLDKGRDVLVHYGSPGTKSRIPTQRALWGLVLKCLSVQAYQGCKKRPWVGRGGEKKGQDRNWVSCWKSLSPLRLQFTDLFNWISASGLIVYIWLWNWTLHKV